MLLGFTYLKLYIIGLSTPAMVPAFPKLHSFARWKAPSLAHTSVNHRGHVPEHTQPCKHYTQAWGLKHPDILFAHSLDLHLQCTVPPHFLPSLLAVDQIYTEMCIPKTASPEVFEEKETKPLFFHTLFHTFICFLPIVAVEAYHAFSIFLAVMLFRM